MARRRQDSEELAKFCLELIRDKVYRNNLKIQMQEGTLHPSVHSLIYHYAVGKPADKFEHHFPDGVPGHEDLTTLTSSELARRAEVLAELARSLDEGTNGNGSGMVN